MPRGGKRPGAGRKKGSGTKKTKKTTRLAQEQAGEGLLPLAVMLLAMRAHVDAGNLDKAAAIARDAAPYLHARQAALTIKSSVDAQLVIKKVIIRVDPEARSNGAAARAPGSVLPK